MTQKFEEGILEKFFEDFDEKEIIYRIFQENKILFHTSDDKQVDNHRHINPKYSFYTYYSEEMQNLNRPIRSYGYILKILKELEDEGFIIKIQDISELRYKRDEIREINNILKAIEPIFDEIKGVLKFNYKKSTKGKSVRPQLYILTKIKKNGQIIPLDPYELLKIEINDIKGIKPKVIIEKIEEEKARLETLEQELQEKWSRELESFSNQILKSKDVSFLNLYYRDLVEYLGNMFFRICPNPECRKVLFDPKIFTKEELDKLDDYWDNFLNGIPISNEEIDKYINKKFSQYLYYMDFETAKKNKSHPLGQIAGDPEEKTKLMWRDSLKKVKEDFICEACGGSIIKERLLEIEKVVFEWTMGVEGNKSALLYGFPVINKALVYGE